MKIERISSCLECRRMKIVMDKAICDYTREEIQNIKEIPYWCPLEDDHQLKQKEE
jgi:hypothetical protein